VLTEEEAENTQRSIFNDDSVMTEIVFRGGGNAQILFRSHDLAIRFKLAMEKRILLEVPGLQMALSYHELQANENLYEGFKMAQKKLQMIKDTFIPLHDATTMGVHEICGYSGQVATQLDKTGQLDERQPISEEIYSKRIYANKKNDDSVRIEQFIQTLTRENSLSEYEFEMPLEFDDLGRTTGESSYIGVVHIDGNGIGRRFFDATQPYRELQGEDDQKNRIQYIQTLRQTSKESSTISEHVVESILRAIVKNLSVTEHAVEMVDLFPLKKEMRENQGHSNIHFLPIRFLVYGGDDITFVAEGRLALELAAIGVKAYESGSAGMDRKVSAAAGVAIIKTRSPFYPAYQWAESLCGKTKEVIKNKDFLKRNGYSDKSYPSAINWVIAEGDVSEWFKESDSGLTMKPYMLTILPQHADSTETVGHWDWLRKQVLRDLHHAIHGRNSEEDDDRERSRRSKFRNMITLWYKGEQFVQKELGRWTDLQIDFPQKYVWKLRNPYTVQHHTEATPFLDAMEIYEFLPERSLEG